MDTKSVGSAALLPYCHRQYNCGEVLARVARTPPFNHSHMLWCLVDSLSAALRPQAPSQMQLLPPFSKLSRTGLRMPRCLPTAKKTHHSGPAGSIAAAMAAVTAGSGRLDILVNNAGVMTVGPQLEADMAETHAMYEANVFGALAMAQAAGKLMVAQVRRIFTLGVGRTVLNVLMLSKRTSAIALEFISREGEGVKRMKRQDAVAYVTRWRFEQPTVAVLLQSTGLLQPW